MPHPRQQMHALAASLTTLPRAQGARPCTLNSRYTRQPPPSPQHPSPKAHNPAPSTADTSTNRSLNPSNPHPRSTTLHPQQQIHALAASLATLPRAQGAWPCTLGSRHPRQPQPPTRLTHTQGAQHRTLNNRCPCQLISSQPPNPRRGHTTLHPQQQMPTQTIPIAAPTPPRAHNPAPSTVIIALPYHPAEHAIACGRSTDASSLASRAASPCHRAVQCDRPRCAPSLLADFPHTSHSVSR